MDINTHKFKELLIKKRISQKELEEKLGLPRTRISVWLNRKSIPIKNVDALNKALGVDLEEYFKTDDVYLTDDLSPGTSPIPFYGEVDITAGALSFWNDSTIHEPTAKYILPDTNADFILPVVGNSMSPYIEAGDKIAVKELIDTSVIFYGAVYVVITEEYRFVKVVRKHLNENNVILHSYNSSYDDIDLPKSKILKMFTVQEILKKIQ